MLSAQLGRLSLASDASNASAFSRAGASAVKNPQNSTPGKQKTPAFASSKLHGRVELHAATLVAEFGDQRSSKIVSSRRSSFEDSRKDPQKVRNNLQSRSFYFQSCDLWPLVFLCAGQCTRSSRFSPGPDESKFKAKDTSNWRYLADKE